MMHATWQTNATRWLIGAAVAAAAGAAALGADATDPVSQARKIREDLVQSSIKAPKDPQVSREELRRAMEQVRGLNPVAKPASAPATLSTLPPDVLEAAMESNGFLDSRNFGLGYGPGMGKAVVPAIPDSVVEELKKLPPEQIADLVALADALYMGGRQPEAFPFYEKALSSKLEAEQKAWVLFQMANCRRRTDVAAAQDLYKRLVTEYPKCPWAGIAMVQQRLLAWYQTTGLVDGPASPATASTPASAGTPATTATPTTTVTSTTAASATVAGAQASSPGSAGGLPAPTPAKTLGTTQGRPANAKDPGAAGAKPASVKTATGS
jgi:tetratricopeptide (TPR) repeat protein